MDAPVPDQLEFDAELVVSRMPPTTADGWAQGSPSDMKRDEVIKLLGRQIHQDEHSSGVPGPPISSSASELMLPPPPSVDPEGVQILTVALSLSQSPSSPPGAPSAVDSTSGSTVRTACSRRARSSGSPRSRGRWSRASCRLQAATRRRGATSARQHTSRRDMVRRTLSPIATPPRRAHAPTRGRDRPRRAPARPLVGR